MIGDVAVDVPPGATPDGVRVATGILRFSVSHCRRNGARGVCHRQRVFRGSGDIERTCGATNQCFYWIFVTER